MRIITCDYEKKILILSKYLPIIVIEENMAQLYDAIGIGIAIVKDDFTILYVNKEIEKKGKVKKEALIDTNLLDYVVPEDRNKVIDMLENCKKGAEKRITIRMITPAGSLFWAHLSCGISEEYYVITLLNVTKTVHSINKAHEKNEELQIAYDFVRTIGVVLDDEQIFEIAYNKIAEIITTMDAFIISTVDEKNKQLVAEFVIGEGKRYPKHRVPLNDMDTFSGWVVLHRKSLYVKNVYKDKLPANLKLIGKPMTSWLGFPLLYRNEVLGAVSVQSKKEAAFTERDIRVLELIAMYLSMILYNAKLYKELKKQEEMYKSLVSSSIVGILSVDMKYRITFVNDALCKILGYDKEELLGKDSLLFVSSRGLDAIKEGAKRRKEGKADAYETYLQRKDGTDIPVWLYAAPLKDEQGTMVGTLVSIVDISMMKELQERLMRAKQFQETLLHMVSHDLKTPLSVIQGYVELLREDFEPEYLNSIEEAVNNALNLIKEVRILSKIDMNKLDESKEEFDLNSLLVIIADAVKSRFQNAKILIHGKPCTIKGYKTLLKEAFINIMINAFKHGASTVDVSVTSDDKKLTVRIADDGPGIEDSKKSKIFESFVKYDSGGSGLGLFIVKRVIDMHNGKIRVEDNKPHGAVFVVELPREDC